MADLLGSSFYGLGVFIAALFVAGSVAVLVAGLGESPLAASGVALTVGLLSYGFGWSSRRLLQGHE